MRKWVRDTPHHWRRSFVSINYDERWNELSHFFQLERANLERNRLIRIYFSLLNVLWWNTEVACNNRKKFIRRPRFASISRPIEKGLCAIPWYQHEWLRMRWNSCQANVLQEWSAKVPGNLQLVDAFSAHAAMWIISTQPFSFYLSTYSTALYRTA